jgi:hypothetical protein
MNKADYRQRGLLCALIGHGADKAELLNPAIKSCD